MLGPAERSPYSISHTLNPLTSRSVNVCCFSSEHSACLLTPAYTKCSGGGGIMPQTLSLLKKRIKEINTNSCRFYLSRCLISNGSSSIDIWWGGCLKCVVSTSLADYPRVKLIFDMQMSFNAWQYTGVLVYPRRVDSFMLGCPFVNHLGQETIFPRTRCHWFFLSQ